MATTNYYFNNGRNKYFGNEDAGRHAFIKKMDRASMREVARLNEQGGYVMPVDEESQ